MKKLRRRSMAAIALWAILLAQLGIPISYAAQNAAVTGEKSASQKEKKLKTETPIEHIIIVIGENRSFDHTFATYTPKKGQKISNLLSKGIVSTDGMPGPNFALAAQFTVPDRKSVV